MMTLASLDTFIAVVAYKVQGRFKKLYVSKANPDIHLIFFLSFKPELLKKKIILHVAQNFPKKNDVTRNVLTLYLYTLML